MELESDGDTDEFKKASSKKRKRENANLQNEDKYKPFIKNGYTRKYPDNGSNGDFSVFVEHTNKEIKIGNMNPLNLSKFFKNIKGVSERSRINANKIKISFNQAALANDFLKANVLAENELRAYIPAASVERVGVVRFIPKDVSNLELFEKITCEKDIIGIRRFMKRENGKLTPFTTISITFSGTTLPEYILLDGWRYKIHSYIPPVLQCYKCFKFNHSAKICHGNQKCSKCAEDHSFKDCSTDNFKCINCGGNHLAISKECPIKSAKINKTRMTYSMAANNDYKSNFPGLPTTFKTSNKNKNYLKHVDTPTKVAETKSKENFNISEIINNTKFLDTIIKTLVTIGNSNSIKTTSQIKDIFIKNLTE